ncbi:MAG: hypothetical protein JWP82_898, partial [Humibacillus sp.]|nr:hypothetical protein [Humibacillus sp.]
MSSHDARADVLDATLDPALAAASRDTWDAVEPTPAVPPALRPDRDQAV